MILFNFFKQGRGRWCKRSFAKDRHGNSVGITNPDAVSFCLAGALMKFYPKDEDFKAAAKKLHDVMPGISMSTFNDLTSYGDLLEVLEKAGV